MVFFLCDNGDKPVSHISYVILHTSYALCKLYAGRMQKKFGSVKIVSGGEEMADENSEEAAKVRLGFSLSAEAQRLLRLMKGKTGLSQTAVVEVAIREKAERMEIK